MKKILILSNLSQDTKYKSLLNEAFVRRDDLSIKRIYQNYTTKRSIVQKIFNKLKLEVDNDNINERLIEELTLNKYDILLLMKGNKIFPWTLKKITKLYPNLNIIGFSNDNMSKWHNKSLWFHFGIKYYDHFFSINIPDYRSIENFYKGKVTYLNKAFEPHLHKKTSERNKFLYEVLFIGSFEKERAEILYYLANNNIKVDIFGNGWSIFKSHQNLIVHNKPLYNEQYVEAINQARITLGFLRKINNDTQTSRTFEIVGCGGFMLMERTREHLELFNEGSEVEYFENSEELLNKIRYYLSNEEKREKIALTGYKTIRAKNYTYDSMINRILKEI